LHILLWERQRNKLTLLIYKKPMNNYTQKEKQAFTLIELLVVIAIIGILAAVTFGGLQVARDRGEATKIIGDIKIIKGALQFRYSTGTAYPTETELETEYPGLAGSAITIPGMITEDVFRGKFTSAPALSAGTGEYIYDADAADPGTGYDQKACGSYAGNDYGVNIILTNAIAVRPNVVSQLDELIDGGDGLDCGLIRRASAVDNSILYNISARPPQFP